ncbi:MAG: magnesium/cobalt transporter CorA [Bacteroidota bacterium]|jgi:magnesium transporter
MANSETKKKRKKQRHNVGAAPGELFLHPNISNHEVKITMIQYTAEEFEEKQFTDVNSCKASIKKGMQRWINVDGVHDQDIIAEFGEWFGIHPLTQEDITHIDSRPKFEEYSRYAVSIIKMLYWENGQIRWEHLSILLFEDTVLSFQEPHGGDAFDMVRLRLRQGKGRVRKMGPDYLSYALIDAVVDHYFVVLEKFGEKIEILDEEVMINPSKKLLIQAHELKKENMQLRKMLWPAREMLLNMIRTDSDLLIQTNTIYIRDVHDHISKANDTVEQFRESLEGIMEMYLSTSSNRLSEVMRALTMISAIFIPVSFIASIYGMNFKYMPWLNSETGFWLTISLMATIMISMTIYFRRKNWW